MLRENPLVAFESIQQRVAILFDQLCVYVALFNPVGADNERTGQTKMNKAGLPSPDLLFINSNRGRIER